MIQKAVEIFVQGKNQLFLYGTILVFNFKVVAVVCQILALEMTRNCSVNRFSFSVLVYHQDKGSGFVFKHSCVERMYFFYNTEMFPNNNTLSNVYTVLLWILGRAVTTQFDFNQNHFKNVFVNHNAIIKWSMPITQH